MIIRKAKKEDVVGIGKVHVDVWKTTYRGFIPDQKIDNLSYEKAEKTWNYNLDIADNIVYIAEDEMAGIVGFVLGGPNRDQEYDYDAEISAIYILQDFQRKGLGQALIQKVCAELIQMGYQRMIIWVLADNASKFFYEKLGGRSVEEKYLRFADTELKTLGMVFTDLKNI